MSLQRRKSMVFSLILTPLVIQPEQYGIYLKIYGFIKMMGQKVPSTMCFVQI